MRYYLGLFVAMIVLFSAMFAAAMAMDIAILNNPVPIMRGEAWWAGLIGVALLIADVLIPVPASLIMIAHGAAFGVLIGTIWSLLGGLGGSLVGFWLGRRGGPLLAKCFPAEARLEADRFVTKHGVWAVVLSRPVPLLSETVAVVAGTTSMSWWKVTVASVAGLLPAALLYAVTGATTRDLSNGYAIFGIVMVIAAIAWLLERRIQPSKTTANI